MNKIRWLVYRRYTLDEIKRKIVDVLQSTGDTGLSGVELADRIGINRMTITKYLDIMHAKGLLKKKKIGNVNIWSICGLIIRARALMLQ